MRASNNKGLALIQYIFIIALILIVVIVAICTLGGEIKDTITRASCVISKKDFVEGEKAGEAYCENRE